MTVGHVYVTRTHVVKRIREIMQQLEAQGGEAPGSEA